MNDKNNRPIKTGDVVEITGAYFKMTTAFISSSTPLAIRIGAAGITVSGASSATANSAPQKIIFASGPFPPL